METHMLKLKALVLSLSALYFLAGPAPVMASVDEAATAYADGVTELAARGGNGRGNGGGKWGRCR